MIKRAWLVAIFILLLAFGTRLHKVETQSLWHDEGNSLRLAERNVDDLVEAASHDIHPPGYYLTLKYWISNGGDSEFGLRGLSIFWGVLAVAGTFALGRRLFDSRVGLLAALLITLNPFAVYYSQEARMYAQLAALSVWSLWFFSHWLRAAHHQTTTRSMDQYLNLAGWSFALGFINVLGLYTQYTFPFTMLVEGIIFCLWWIQGRDWRALLVFFNINLLTLIHFTPWVFTAYEQVTNWPSTGDLVPLADRLERIVTILAYGQTVNNLTISLSAPVFILVFLGLIPRRTSQHPLWQLGIPSLLILISITGLLVSGSYRETNLKFLLPAQIALALLLSAGVVRLPRYGWLVTAPLFLLMLWHHQINLDDIYNNAEFARSDYRTIAQVIDDTAKPDSAIILNAANQQEAFTYYYAGDLAIYSLPQGLSDPPEKIKVDTQAVIDQHARIYLVLWGATEHDTRGTVQATLDEQAYFINHKWYADVQLLQYAVLGDVPNTPESLLGIDFGDNLTLQGYTLSASSFQSGAGDVLGVSLYWEIKNPLDKPYQVSIQLLNPDGSLAAQGQDSPLDQNSNNSVNSQAIVIGDNLGTGVYTLIVGVYDPVEPLNRLIPSDQANENNGLIIGTIEIR